MQCISGEGGFEIQGREWKEYLRESGVKGKGPCTGANTVVEDPSRRLQKEMARTRSMGLFGMRQTIQFYRREVRGYAFKRDSAAKTSMLQVDHCVVRGRIEGRRVASIDIGRVVGISTAWYICTEAMHVLHAERPRGLSYITVGESDTGRTTVKGVWVWTVYSCIGEIGFQWLLY
ncbi:uncharacterized protein LAESUDRAFT_713290 [Laetiporus sulphureus 93-53]|uniref:Uncharacterized protein n=1 Tax=Laetiporus sulphureus 93-53 TaxID=1314785 RepID=A0A165EZ15_9APHY|nr:uncharacterized protein LAESUDRAFT_713290 [Laetiporus sulphureus 93-53]KZT08015.1 hypothetical protein LAESUDRAFT_713290 [Laetiporus sulphureus 93-53]